MMFSYVSKSQNNETRTPAHQRRPQPQLEPQTKPVAVIDYTKCNEVQEDKMWKQAVKNEEKAVKRWQDNWEFLTEYDEKGNYVGKEELPEYQSRFSDGTVPNTNAGVYGSRAQTDNTQNMLRLEQMLSAPNRRKKLDSEMVCY